MSTPLTVVAMAIVACFCGCNGSHAAETSIGATLVDGPRAIASTDLLSLRDIGDGDAALAVSPDGIVVAFQLQQGDVVTNSFKTGWYVMAINSGESQAVNVGAGGDIILYGEDVGSIGGARVSPMAKWSPDSEWIAYRLKRDDEIQLWRSRRDGTVQEQLTHNDADVVEFRWSADGTRLIYTVGTPRDKLHDSLREEGDRGYLFDDRFIPGYATRPVFESAANADIFSAEQESNTWVYEIEAESERMTTPAERQEMKLSTVPNDWSSLVADRDRRETTFQTDTEQVGWLENVDPVTYGGFYPPLTLHAVMEDGHEQRCGAPECTGRLESPQWTANGDEVLVLRREGVKFMTNAIYAWTPGEETVRTILRTDDLIDDCELALHRLICVHESPTTPRKIVAIDIEDGRIQALLDPNPEFQNIALTRVERLEWQEASGADVVGHLVYPAGYEEGKRYPMVVVQYRSRGFLRGGVGDEYPIHPLAANGFFVLSFDRPEKYDLFARSSDSYGIERAYWGDDLWEKTSALSALEIMIDKLDGRGLIDPKRVGITGLSDGAETLWYGLIHSDRFAAAAVSDGSWSPSWFYLANQQIRQEYYVGSAGLRAPGIGGDDAYDRWRRISAELNVDQINEPVLIQVADHELLGSAATIGALKDAYKPIETYVFPDEYHIKWQPKHKLAIYERTIDWFNFWLRGVENSEPLDPEQYTRWRKLRQQHIENLKAVGREYTLPLGEGVTETAVSH